ncbi:MAG: tRNA epoxyqueuosine(34) reductase QueG [Pseudomonadales bacterium]|nr:tRNA epoxyqueuosine(34) reductase QueG [Pseudomonadales bacterium]NIX07112.1 tRNA epoxyqueuosine(34) reductase QueG [Pseudomonadales bacterium]
MVDLAALRQDIETWARELGFAQVGVTDVDLSAHEPHVRAWLQKGFQGSMSYLERNLAKRLHPERLEPETCRVIAARMDYLADGHDPREALEDPDRAYVSRYALGRDYHKLIRGRLAKLAGRIDSAAAGFEGRYRAFTDSAPVLEKALAEKAGLGWIGKNTLLLNSKAGSWFFLGEIYTNLPLPVDEPEDPGDDGCGNCTACMTVCPTDAIVGPGQLDARRCISYLTIELKEAIPEPLRASMGNRIFGCDDCQIYCPWNRFAGSSGEADFEPRHGLDSATLLDLFAWSAETFELNTRGSALRRISWDQWRRNLAVALGNGSPSAAALQALQDARAGASEMVREHVDWAIRTLTRRSGGPEG